MFLGHTEPGLNANQGPPLCAPTNPRVDTLDDGRCETDGVGFQPLYGMLPRHETMDASRGTRALWRT
jgi:hypothetical protein